MSLYSECCSWPPAGGMEEYGICGKCKEHCEFYDDDEYECSECGEFEDFWNRQNKTQLKEAYHDL